MLSEHLAERARHVHVVELDRRLEPPLRDALDSHPNATLHFADAVKLDLAALDPAPTKVVANLPYGVAASVILRTVESLPTVTTWVAMVQKEVGERFAAEAGTGAYGVPSVLAQLACDVKVIRPVSRNVFFPVPNVDSVLLRLLRARRSRRRRSCARSSSRASPTAARRSPGRSRSGAATATRCARRSTDDGAARERRAPRRWPPTSGASCTRRL